MAQSCPHGKEVLKKIAPILRDCGFRGSGQNFRKLEGDFVFVINFQGSQWGDVFYVNLGAQPVFIPAEGNSGLAKLKAHECWLRRRVGESWPWQIKDQLLVALVDEIVSTQEIFFRNAQTLRSAIPVDSVEELLRKFSSGATQARATLHLARAAAKLGYPEKARSLITHGLKIAGESATILRYEVQHVL